jgi:predicted enzyme related to lactoylglutathione lyase
MRFDHSCVFSLAHDMLDGAALSTERWRGSQNLAPEKTMPQDKPARPNFIELPTHDIAAAQAFYAAAFGWHMTAFGPTYACTMTGDVDVGLQADRAEATAAPLPVIEVAALEAALAMVKQAGGTITKPIFGFPGGRRFHFRDPSGNELAAMQAD